MMSASSKTLLVLGAGGRVGASLASLFSKNGYAVALAARSLDDGKVNDAGHLQLRVDLADAKAVKPTFQKVEKHFGVSPSCVVYNAASAHFVSKEHPLALSVEDLQEDFVVNSSNVLVAAQQALEGFDQLPATTKKSFIYTGNFLNVETMPALLSNGMGKSAAAHMLRVAAETYGSKGYHFYYADERVESGFAAFRDLSGPNSAEHYLALAEAGEQLPWLQTFVGGKGYQDFSNM